ncbi:MAG: tRNA pseudouridine(55) synthase TruB [Alphaproteobacteria bacterium]
MLKKSGWIFIDKPIGLTSNSLLQKVRLNLGRVKAGFVGTLDPLASGCLPIAVGHATKVINLAEKVDKEYIFTICWGKQTDTGDLEGKVIKEKKEFPLNYNIKKILPNFVGTIQQTPPRYSSIKINGLRAYTLARKKIGFELKKREVKIFSLKLLKQLSLDKAEFYVKCSSGTYIRSLAESISEALGTVGVLIQLRRVGFGNFNKKLISLDYFLSLVHSDERNKVIEPIDQVFSWIKVLEINEKQLNKVLNGNCIEMSFFENDKFINPREEYFFARHKSEIVALGLIKKKNFYPKRILVS